MAPLPAILPLIDTAPALTAPTSALRHHYRRVTTWPSSRDLLFDAAHIMERIRLLIISQLGETAPTTGTAIPDAPLDAAGVATGPEAARAPA